MSWLSKTVKNPLNAVAPIGIVGGVNNKLADMLGIHRGANINHGDPNAQTGQPFDFNEFLKNPAFQTTDPNQISSDAFDKYLQSTQAATQRGEQQSTQNVLDQLQGRGIADSGIALKDVVAQVLGPSLERQNNLAAQFGLGAAQSAANAGNQMNQSRLQGLLGALGGQQNNAYENQLLQAKMAYEGQQNKEARSRQRKGALFGLLGGILGSGLGQQDLGTQLGQTAALW